MLVLTFGVPRVDAEPEYSANWSGYVTAARGGEQITAVSGSWIVPLIRNAPPGFSSSWVGIGGFHTSDLIQAGTASSGMLEGNYAWYEMLPENETRIESGCAGDATCSVHQGDRIATSVTNVGGNTWVISMTNAGKWSWSKTVSYASSRSSAEWIFEAPTVGLAAAPVIGVQTLPAYAPHAKFLGGGNYRVNGVTRPLNASNAKRMIMTDLATGLYRTATPSLLAGDGHFTVCAYKRTCPNF
jgi:hypothetical protein